MGRIRIKLVNAIHAMVVLRCKLRVGLLVNGSISLRPGRKFSNQFVGKFYTGDFECSETKQRAWNESLLFLTYARWRVFQLIVAARVVSGWVSKCAVPEHC